MNPYTNFRRPGIYEASFNSLSRRFDEPTYLTFRLEFGKDVDINYNGAGVGTLINYDIMPHPLFMPKTISNLNERTLYSAIDYLMDANEFTRALMLRQFINKLRVLQSDFQWYFQKVDGLENLLKVNIKSGMRVKSDGKLTITTLEGLDLRMSHLLTLYKKIAWDDVYQRWVLPDMMRYFTLNIYISEFRTFHTVNQYNGIGAIDNDYSMPAGEVMLRILNDTLPTWKIKCEMCEFDIESIKFTHVNSLSVNVNPEQAACTFDIKIGKVYEEQVYPMFKSTYLSDKVLNGFDRARQFQEDRQSITNGEEFDSTAFDQNNNWMQTYKNLGVAQDTMSQEEEHISTAPFNENSNQKTLYGAKGPGPDGEWFTDDDAYNVNSTEPNTWVKNAMSWGTNFVANKVEDFVNKAKTMEIPGLGLSATEIQSAIQSKDIISTLGLIKKGINKNSEDNFGPNGSELLINESIFKAFLTGLSQSKATDEDGKFLVQSALEALGNNNIYGQITDFSRATNLVGNIPQVIQGENEYKNLMLEQSNNDRSTATDLDGGPNTIQLLEVFESTPTSAATTNKLIKG